MKALIHLTASEGKKLIGRAIVGKILGTTLEKGIVAIHPSSTASFIFEEIAGRRPSGVWVCGVIVSRGMCVSRELEQVVARRKPGFDQVDFMHTWVFDRGKLQEEMPLGKILEGMGEGDFYVKTPNVIDGQGQTGVFHANPDGGTIIRVLRAKEKKKFSLLIPVSCLKSISTPLETASRALGVQKIDVSMGIPVGLLPLKGRVVTEREAIELLSGAKATHVATGGLNDGEGNTSYVADGGKEEVESLLSIVRSIKGTPPPMVSLPECRGCAWKSCHFRGKDIPSI